MFTVISALATVLSGICAWLSYKLAQNIKEELKSDERIIPGTPIHPDLREHAHSQAVIQCTLFNKSKRKAYIASVSVFDQNGVQIPIAWSDQIDNVGNPQNQCQLIGMTDSSSLFIRRNDGEAISYARMVVTNSFTETPLTIIFDQVGAWKPT